MDKKELEDVTLEKVNAGEMVIFEGPQGEGPQRKIFGGEIHASGEHDDGYPPPVDKPKTTYNT